MTEKEFWSLYNRKYKGNMDIIVENRPLGGDDGFFKISCYKKNRNTWCIERTVERSNSPSQTVYHSEQDAYNRFLEMVHTYSKSKNQPLPKQKKNNTGKKSGLGSFLVDIIFPTIRKG